LLFAGEAKALLAHLDIIEHNEALALMASLEKEQFCTVSIDGKDFKLAANMIAFVKG
jgi:hypothetical protein